MSARLFAVGLVTLLGQVCLLRELNVAFFGTELIYVLALGAWLLWGAMGAWLGPRRSSPDLVRWLLLAFCVVLGLTLPFVRGLRPVFGGVAGAYLPFGRQLIAVLLSLMGPALLTGWLFGTAAKSAVEAGSGVGRAYAVESLGGLVGGILATVLLAFGISNLEALLTCCALALAAASLPSLRKSSRLAIAAGVVGLVLLVAMVRVADLDRAMTAWTHPDLLVTRDSPYGRVTLGRAQGQIAAFVNDALVFESEGTSAEEFVHLATLQVTHPGRILVLGGVSEGLVREAMQHRPEVLDAVELDEVFLREAMRHASHADRSALMQPEVRVHIADGRSFLERDDRYDLIIMGLPEPDSGQVNRFYTAEFFARCASRLAPGGVLAIRLRSLENQWTPHLTRRMSSIRAALLMSFADVLVLPGGTNVVLASQDRLVRDPAELSARWQARGIRARLVSPQFLRYVMTNDRVTEIQDLLAGRVAPPNTDAHPTSYRDTMLLWLSRFHPGLAMWEPDLARIPAGMMVVVLLLWLGGLAVVRRHPGVRRSLLMGMVGLAGMGIESVLILNDQIRRGLLFQDVGLLMTLFMTGLAVGALTIGWRGWGAQRRLVAALVSGFGLMGIGSGWIVQAGWVTHLGLSGGLLLLTGGLVGGLFAAVGGREPTQSARIVAPLYAADLLGGAIGAVLGGLVLVPFVGLGETAALLGIFVLTALILV